MPFRYQYALDILAEEIGKFDSSIEVSMARHTGPLVKGRSLDWWMHLPDDGESPTTDRNKAYLRTYMRLVGVGKLWAEGLPLADHGRIYLDRSIMRRLYKHGYVGWVEKPAPHFILTDKGRQLLVVE